jgi:hypothetical protein
VYLVVVILCHGVRLERSSVSKFTLLACALTLTYYGTQDCGGQPSQGLFHDTSDVWQLVEVFHLRESVAADLFELCLGLFLDFWVEDHCFDKSV